MADVTLYAGETRYVEFPVNADADPLGDAVSVAFVEPGTDPTDADWHVIAWTPGQTWTSGQPVLARVLIGPAALVLAEGTYNAIVSVGDVTETPWMFAGTIRIRSTITASALRTIRAELGSSPDDDELADLWTDNGHSAIAVALAVLRPRRADALAAAAGGGFTLSGVIGTTAPAAAVLAQLDAQIARLEGQLAIETGDADTSGLAASSVIAGRYDRLR